MRKKVLGFTLIELLIVIGVLGILASGLLAAVDPFEQLKKARDANNRNAAVEVLNAMTRYYATHGVLPWNSTTSPCSSTTDGGTFQPIRNSASGFPPLVTVPIANTTTQGFIQTVNDCITNTLVADGELKSGFFSGLSTKLYLGSGSTTRVVVCYAPEGKALRNDTIATAWSFPGGSGTAVDDTCAAADRPLGYCLQCFE